jgi:serine/threonine protein kinase
MTLAFFQNMMDFVKFDEKNKLGEGSCESAFAGVREASSARVSGWGEIEVVVKRTREPVTDDKEKQLFMREVDILSKIRHPACLSLLAFSTPPDGMYHVVTEKREFSLDHFVSEAMKGNAPAEWDDTSKSIVALGVASGLAYLHSKNIIHREVKPSSVLLDSHFYPYLSNFHFAKIISPDKAVRMTSGIGTPLFMAPELLVGSDDYGFPVDVYAYGMMLYIILTESNPFPDARDPFRFGQRIMDGRRPKIPSYVPEYYRHLISDCWDADPKCRPTFADIIANPDALMFYCCDEAAFNYYRFDVLRLP